jgi:Protein of unknown function (DUF3828)
MHSKRLVTIVVTVIICAAGWSVAGALSAPDANSAKAFLDAAYQQYRNGGKGVPLTARYYHSTLLALADRDQKAAGPENVGALDADPLCDCQDWEGVWDLKIDVQMKGTQRASANVSFALSAPGHRKKDDLRKLQIVLAWERGGWRIYDITSLRDPDKPWRMREELEKDIESLARRPVVGAAI